MLIYSLLTLPSQDQISKDKSLALLFDNKRNKIISDCSQTTDNFLQSLLEILSKDPHWRNGIYIKSRVALIRARYVSKDIDCDITFNNELAMANTKLIKYFYNIQPECKLTL